MKTVFTTGQVARMCKVSQQTIIRCFDSGKLRGFRVPGSKFRRIPISSLRKFMLDNGIPSDDLDSGQKRALVVDDDLAIIDMLTDILNRDGRFEVRTATTGFDAGIETKGFQPDIILLDYKLPDINGDALCKRIRSDPAHEHIRVIVISGVADPSEVQRLLDCGADDFIKKPFDIDKLVARMAELVGLVA